MSMLLLNKNIFKHSLTAQYHEVYLGTRASGHQGHSSHSDDPRQLPGLQPAASTHNKGLGRMQHFHLLCCTFYCFLDMQIPLCYNSLSSDS